MVCAKCQKLQKKTELATPGVKRKNEMYYGSSASSTVKSSDKSKSSATLGMTGIGKVKQLDFSSFRLVSKLRGANHLPLLYLQSKLLSKSAKNPYDAYSSSCITCKKKIDQGRTLCHRCAYKANSERIENAQRRWVGTKANGFRSACAMCGKSQNKGSSPGEAPIVQGQRFSAK